MGIRSATAVPRKVAAGVLVSVLGASLTVGAVSAAPASAASCPSSSSEYTAINTVNSWVWEKASSACGNLNGLFTTYAADQILGEWQDLSGTFHVGTAGWQYVPYGGNSGSTTLLTSVVVGTAMRGAGHHYSQYVTYSF